MGLLSSIFGKAGHWHIRQLAKECVDMIIKASMAENKQLNNPFLTDSALDFLIEHGHYKLMTDNSYKSLKEKYAGYVAFYINRNLGRDIDHLGGEMTTINEEIEKYWPVIKSTKNGVLQKLKPLKTEPPLF